MLIEETSQISKELLSVNDLSVEFDTYSGKVKALTNVNLTLKSGEVLGILGESGSGKSTLALAIMALLPENAHITGSVSFSGSPYMEENTKVKRKARKILDEKLRNIRWEHISMIFQGAMNAFNPVYTIGKQLREVFLLHTPLSKEDIENKIDEVLISAGLTPSVKKSYPHELSGGMKQRAMIAMALSLDPDIVIADEPTTGLDVITQAEIIGQLKKLMKSGRIKSMIIISHDIGVVAQLADHMTILYASQIMEYGTTKDIYLNSRNPYTMELLKSYPSIRNSKNHVEGIPGRLPDPTNLPEGCKFAERCYLASSICVSQPPPVVYLDEEHYSLCHFAKDIKENERKDSQKTVRLDYANTNDNCLEIIELTKYFDLKRSFIGSIYGEEGLRVHAVDHVTFNLKRGQILGLVGESGSGKSTLAKLLIGILKPTSGKIYYYPEGEEKIDLSSKDTDHNEYMKFASKRQMIFQDSYDSINPKMNVLSIVAEPLIGHKMAKDKGKMLSMVKNALINSNLSPPEKYLDRYPHELSGGERQRVAMARSIVLDSEFIIADEPTSMLDISLRASFMNLLDDIRRKKKISVLYISHDIASVYYLSDYILVIYLGVMVEIGSADDIITNPQHPYTKALIKSVPDPNPNWKPENIGIIGEIGNSINVPKGCRFFDRCVFRKEICKDTPPPLRTPKANHLYLCHFDQEDLVVNEEMVQDK